MRTKAEIARAHDLLVSIILREVPVLCSDQALEGMQAACDVLCWVLKHGHNTQFEENLKELEEAVAKTGFKLTLIPIQ